MNHGFVSDTWYYVFCHVALSPAGGVDPAIVLRVRAPRVGGRRRGRAAGVRGGAAARVLPPAAARAQAGQRVAEGGKVKLKWLTVKGEWQSSPHTRGMHIARLTGTL